MRSNPLYYIAPSAISITPNANNSANDLAVYIAQNAKIKVYEPTINDLDTVDAAYQEWTLSGRNRRLADATGNVPYTIYARLRKVTNWSDAANVSAAHEDAYLVFAPQTWDEDAGEYKDPYVLSPNTSASGGMSTTDRRGRQHTWQPIPTRQAAEGRAQYWWVKLGTVSKSVNNVRTVDLDTGILGTDEYNAEWQQEADTLPLRVVLGSTIDGEDMGQAPYVAWGKSVALAAHLVEGWDSAVDGRVERWTITRNTGEAESDAAWNYPDDSSSDSSSSSSEPDPADARRMPGGQAVLSHLRSGTDDFAGAVAATFTVTAWGYEGTGSSELTPLAVGIITVYAETVERYELALDTNVVNYNPQTNAYTPVEGVGLRIRGTAQDGVVFYLSQAQITAAGLVVVYAPVNASEEDEVEVVFVNGRGVIPTEAFASRQNVSVRLLNAGDVELSRQVVAFIRDGEDSREREWIFLRSAEPITFGTQEHPYPASIRGGQVNPTGAATGEDTDSSQDGWVPQGWWDDMLGTSAEYPYEYCSYRDYNGNNSDSSSSDDSSGNWGPFTEPKLWGHFGQNGTNAVRINLDNQADIISLDSEGKVRFARTVVVRANIYNGSTVATSGVTKHSSLTPANLTIGGCVPTVSAVTSGTVTITWAFTKGIAAAAATKEISLVYKGETYTAVFSLGTTDADAVWQVVPNPSTVKFSLDTSTNTLSPASQSLKCGYTRQTGSGTDYVSEAAVTNGQIIHDGTSTGLYLYYRALNNDVWGNWVTYPSAGLTVAAVTTVQAYEFCISSSTSYGNVADANIIDRETAPVIKDGTNGDAGAAGDTPMQAYQWNQSPTVAPTLPTNGNYDNGWTATAPPRPTTAGKYYLWMTQCIKSVSSSGIATYTNWSTAVRISGDDGGEGAAGKDGWTVFVSPNPLIIEQNINDPSDFGFSPSNPLYIDFTARCGDAAATVGTVTATGYSALGLTMSSYTSGNHRLRITAYNKVGGKYVSSGKITCSVPLSYGGRSVTMTVVLSVGVNLLGEWESKIIGDAEISIARKISYAATGEQVDTIETIGTYIRSSSENISTLQENVGELSENVTSIEQTTTGISLAVSQQSKLNENFIRHSSLASLPWIDAEWVRYINYGNTQAHAALHTFHGTTLTATTVYDSTERPIAILSTYVSRALGGLPSAVSAIQTVSVSNNSVYTFSIWARRVAYWGSPSLGLFVNNMTDVSAQAYNSSGTVDSSVTITTSTASSGYVSFTPQDNDWHLYVLVFKATANSITAQIRGWGTAAGNFGDWHLTRPCIRLGNGITTATYRQWTQTAGTNLFANPTFTRSGHYVPSWTVVASVTAATGAVSYRYNGSEVTVDEITPMAMERFWSTSQFNNSLFMGGSVAAVMISLSAPLRSNSTMLFRQAFTPALGSTLRGSTLVFSAYVKRARSWDQMTYTINSDAVVRTLGIGLQGSYISAVASAAADNSTKVQVGDVETFESDDITYKMVRFAPADAEWHRVWMAFTLNADAATYGFELAFRVNVIYGGVGDDWVVTKPKLEIGSLPTAWVDYTGDEIKTVLKQAGIDIDAMNVDIRGENISLEGTVTANDGFGIGLDGSMYANNGTFAGIVRTKMQVVTPANAADKLSDKTDFVIMDDLHITGTYDYLIPNQCPAGVQTDILKTGAAVLFDRDDGLFSDPIQIHLPFIYPYDYPGNTMTFEAAFKLAYDDDTAYWAEVLRARSFVGAVVEIVNQMGSLENIALCGIKDSGSFPSNPWVLWNLPYGGAIRLECVRETSGGSSSTFIDKVYWRVVGYTTGISIPLAAVQAQ